MEQLALAGFETIQINAQTIVNVASVPQRSPFRYPGGKTWLVPTIRKWLASLPTKPRHFIEPFVGGGIVSLTVGFEQLADTVTLVEIDPQVGAVWQTLINGRAKDLAEQILRFELNPANLTQSLQQPVANACEEAFKTILKNRVNRGGILAPGAGRIKVGENGKDLHSRWYPQTLYRRILDISNQRHVFRFILGDGIEIMQRNRQPQDTVFFIDPPYSAAGKKAGSRLYTYSELDHEKLFSVTSQLAGDFLMTYDDCDEIRRLAIKYNFATATVAMKNTHHAKMQELLISRKLDWLEK